MSQGSAKKRSLDHGDLTGLSDDDHTFYPKGEVGYHEETSTTQTGITSIVDVTDVSVTFTADSSRVYKVTGGPQGNNPNTDQTEFRLFFTTDGGATNERLVTHDLEDTNDTHYGMGSRRVTGLSGSTTVQLRVAFSGGTNGDLQAASTVPLFILVEDIGAA